MSNFRPEMLLPDFEFYSKSDKGWTQFPSCTADGSQTHHPEPHAHVPLNVKNLYVKLPKHRVFVQLGPKGNWKEVSGYVKLRSTTNVTDIFKAHFKNHAIIEIDMFQILKSSKYLKDGDINNKIVPCQKTYLLTGQLHLFRGKDVASVGYVEHRDYDAQYKYHIGPLLRELGGLRYVAASLEQACRSIQMQRAELHAPLFPGSQVLRIASGIHYDNRFLVRY